VSNPSDEGIGGVAVADETRNAAAQQRMVVDGENPNLSAPR
jgi:hypothetical protein